MWRRMVRTTQRDFAYSLLVWLNYLAAVDSNRGISMTRWRRTSCSSGSASGERATGADAQFRA